VAKRIRGSAKVLSYFYADPSLLQSQLNHQTFVDYYNTQESQWLLPAIALLVSQDIAAEKGYAFEVVGGLLESANMDFAGRRSINFALREWRELARAPVQRLASPQLWA
jgi:hypothetical protein